MQLGRGRGGVGGGGVTSQLSRLLELARRVRHSVVDQVGGGEDTEEVTDDDDDEQVRNSVVDQHQSTLKQLDQQLDQLVDQHQLSLQQLLGSPAPRPAPSLGNTLGNLLRIKNRKLSEMTSSLGRGLPIPGGQLKISVGCEKIFYNKI